MQIKVPVVFRGEVIVEVPDDAVAPRILAKKLALAQVLATEENPDCGESLMDACQEYEAEGGCEEDFDAAKVLSVSGMWQEI